MNRGSKYKKWAGSKKWSNSKHKSVKNPPTIEVPNNSGINREWNLYFPDEAFSENSVTHQKIQAMKKYITNNQNQFNFTSIIEKLFCTLDVKKLYENEQFISDWESFPEDLKNNPEHTVNCLGFAMHHTIHIKREEEIRNPDQDETIPAELPQIKVRIINYEPIIQLKHLKVNFYDKLVSVKGTVIRASSTRLQCTRLAWQCGACATIQTVRQPEGTFSAPDSCPAKGCKTKSRFKELLSHPLTTTVDWQSIKLQETIANEQCEGGRVPRTIECELTDDLVDSCIPGDDITITGIVKVRNNETNKPGKEANMFLLYVQVVSLINNKNQSIGGKKTSNAITGIEFVLKDYYAIQKIHAEPGLLRLLVHSLCPTIFGQEIMKLGLLLGLFGGGIGRPETRTDPHILLVGDPGLGKSQLLQACATVAPRGVYVWGNTSTSAGLTVTLTRESGGDFALEAGALVLADQGVCCIDEFDKMTTQHQALLEAMEQQTISIAKAGVVCTLDARCSILAAANPAAGHYNKAKTVAENIKLGSALLSRFDLVFILMDRPDKHLDKLLSEHVLALHSALKNKVSTSESVCSTSSGSTYQPDIPLRQRLQVDTGESLDLIPFQLLRKYIAYARRYVRPKLSPGAAEVLQTFYIQLRRQHQTDNSTPVTARQLQAAVRLTQARAKLELRELATERDALDIVEVMRYSLVDTFSDQFHNLDFKRSQNGSGVSSRGQVMKFLRMLQQTADRTEKSLFTFDEMREVAQRANITGDLSTMVSTLNIQGFLIKKGPKKYEVVALE